MKELAACAANSTGGAHKCAFWHVHNAAGRLDIERCRKTDSRNAQATLVDGLFLICKEVCNRLHISPCSLQDYRNRKIIPYTQFVGKILYKESLLEKNVGGEFLFKLI